MEENILALVRDNGFLYTKDVVNAGIRKEKLKNLVDEGILIREARGLYSFTNQFTDEYSLLQIRYPKSIFSHETALFFHGLTDRSPSVIVMTIPQSYTVTRVQLEFPYIAFHRIQADLWPVGVTEVRSPQGGLIKLYNLERCICDMVRHKKHTDPQVFSQSIKAYFSSDRRDIIQLMAYAKLFNITEKIQSYMEVL